MELLDDTLDISGELSTEEIKEVFRLRQEHSKALKAINNARIVLAIICVFSVISFFLMISTIDDPLVLSITGVFVLTFGICAAVPPEYAKISLSIALGLYVIDLLAAFLNPSMLLIFSLIVKGIFIYFLVLGIKEALKFTDILKKMERLKIKPYKY